MVHINYRNITDEDKNGKIVMLAIRKTIPHPQAGKTHIVDNAHTGAAWDRDKRIWRYANGRPVTEEIAGIIE